MKRMFSGLLTAVILITCLTACGAEPRAEKRFLAMDTAIRLTAHGGSAVRAVREGESCILDLETLFSRTLEYSDVSTINDAAGDWVQVNTATARLLKASAEYAAVTDGAFDVTIAPVVEAWGFTTDTRQVPDAAQLQALLPLADSSLLQTEIGGGEKSRAACGAGQIVDLGGIAKGYVSDRMADIFAKRGITGGLAALGGNVLAYGAKEDGTAWKVGVQDPRYPGDVNAMVGIIELKNAFAVTSGGYQRFFEENGKTYHHIIDPSTGYPADSSLTSVTVIASCAGEDTNGAPGSGTMCDAFSTALFVMGEEAALGFWRGSDYDFDLILVTADDRVVATAGARERFDFSEESGYHYEIVT